jgi:predicted DsbA family dithiol-disulfide isomerase
MEIKMFSDTICGWCYIGKKRLDDALQRLDLPNSIVTHLPFQLNPQMPNVGMNRLEYVKTKFGNIENAKPMYDNMIMQGEQEDLEIKLDKIKVTPNTVKSHLLIDLSREQNKEHEVINELFHFYFTKAKDIGNEEVLINLGRKYGIEEKKIKDCFSSEINIKKINEMDVTAKKMGITGVPFFVFNDKNSLSGAQPVENLIEAIQQSSNG